MPYVYLDDDFPEHEKVEQAGEDAAWLYVLGLCWTNRKLTGGRILKTRVPRLTTKKKPEQLAARLVDAGLWIDDGDAYVINNYEERNRSAMARKEKSSNAAKVRWERERARQGSQSNGDRPQIPQDVHTARSTARSTAPSTAPSSARPMPYAGAPTWGVGHGVSPEGSKEQPASLAVVGGGDRPAPAGSGFEQFWAAYPRKAGRSDARKAWLAHFGRLDVGPATLSTVLRRVEAWRAAWVAEGRASRYWPGPTKWLDDGCWSRDPEPVVAERRRRSANEEAILQSAREAGLDVEGLA